MRFTCRDKAVSKVEKEEEKRERFKKSDHLGLNF